MSPALFFFLKIVLAIWDLLWFHTNFRIVYSISIKSAIEILIGIASSLQIAFSCMEILAVLILSVYEHEVSFHIMSYNFQWVAL